MKTPPAFLTTKLVQEIHQRMIAEFGGDAGLRDQGLLEAAVAMPMATFGGQFLHPSVPEMVAAYLFHICKNHPFVDGNKRTALATSLVFLDLNNYSVKASDSTLEALTLGVADGRVDKQATTAFFKMHARKLRKR